MRNGKILSTKNRESYIKLILASIFLHLKQSIFELSIKNRTDLDKIQIFLQKKQYSYMIIFSILMMTYLTIKDITEENVKFYIIQVCFIMILVTALFLLNKIRDNYIRPLVSLLLILNPVLLIERCFARPNLYNSYSVCIVFLTAEIIFFAVLINQKFFFQVSFGSVFHFYLFYRVQLFDEIKLQDLTFFFVALLLIAIVQGATMNTIRREINIFRMNEEGYDSLIKSTTHLMKVVISCPVYILSFNSFEEISKYFSYCKKGEVENSDVQFLRKKIAESANLKYFDQDDEIMEKVSTDGIFNFIEDLYYDANSIFTLELEEQCSEAETHSTEKSHPEQELKLRERVSELNFKGQNASDIFLSLYKLLIDFNISTKGYKVKLQDISNKKYLDENSELKYYDIEMIFESYQNKNSIIIIMKDEKTRYDLNELRVEKENKDAILASIVHDMRAPLHAIMGFSEILTQEEDFEDYVQEHLNTIKINSEHLNMLVQDILDSTRIRKGKMNLDKKFFILNHMIKECVKVGKGMIKDKKIAILRKCSKEIRMISDEHRLKRVILNLLTNAIKFTTEGMIIINVVENQDGTVTLSVSDTGAGMKKRTLKNLFKAFNSYNDASGNLNKDGIGLGLAISLAIVKKMGPDDRIHVESRLGEGSKFTFTVYQDLNAVHLFRKRKLKTFTKGKSVFDDVLAKNNIKSPRNNSGFGNRKQLKLVKGRHPLAKSALINKEEYINTTIKKTNKIEDSDDFEFKEPEKGKTWGGRKKSLINGVDEFISVPDPNKKKKQLKPILEDTSDKSENRKVLETEERGLMDHSNDSINVPRTQNVKKMPKRNFLTIEAEVTDHSCQSYNIFLLDDEMMNINLLECQIKRFIKIEKIQKKITTQKVNEYKKAVNLIEKNLEKKIFFSLVITDFNLDKGYTGLQFVRKVKQIYKTHGISRPIFILISGEEIVKDDFEEFDEVLQKAYKFEKFRKMMKSWYDEQVERDIAEEGIKCRFRDRLPSGFLSQQKIKVKSSLNEKKHPSSKFSKENIEAIFNEDKSNNECPSLCEDEGINKSIPKFHRVKRSTNLDDI